jgi:hypothetical protein
MWQTPLERSDGFPILEIDSHYLLMEGRCFVKNILGMIFDFKKLILFNARAQRRQEEKTVWVFLLAALLLVLGYGAYQMSAGPLAMH